MVSATTLFVTTPKVKTQQRTAAKDTKVFPANIKRQLHSKNKTEDVIVYGQLF